MSDTESVCLLCNCVYCEHYREEEKSDDSFELNPNERRCYWRLTEIERRRYWRFLGTEHEEKESSEAETMDEEELLQ